MLPDKKIYEYTTPHIVVRARNKRLELVETTHEGSRALPVFRSEADAHGYMEDSGNGPEEGCQLLPVDHQTLAGLLAIMGIDHAALL